MTEEQTIIDARSDALRWQADARNRAGESAPSSDELDRERVWALGSAGAHVADALLAITGWPPVALDADTLAPSSAPLTTPAQVWGHYRHRNADGTGLVLGRQPGGAVVVAMRGTAKSWADWCAEHAVASSAPRFEDGSGPAMRSYKDLGHFVSVSWQPPPTGFRSSGVAFGRVELDAAAEAMRPRRIGADERGWLLWALPAGDRPVLFPASRRLGPGLDVLGDALVPLHAVRADGWQTQLSGLPVVETMPPWLVAELGGRYGKRAA
ncbi:MAG: hypothetical protein H0U35_05100 [Sporichthyaceae bacterium]|nr:hypothetical protein [Sporichthyaceae bacterium]